MDLAALKESIIKGKRKDALELTQQAVNESCPPDQVLNTLTEGMSIIGQRFKANEVFVPEVMISARAMKAAMEILEPELVKSGLSPEYRIIIGTVKGDLHDIGKNIVAMMLRGANFEVIDLGVDVTPEKFVEAARENSAQIIAMSALLTTTMTAMEEVVKSVKASGLDVKTMIGGAPITEDYANEIGASGYSEDAHSAVELAKELVGAA